MTMIQANPTKAVRTAYGEMNHIPYQNPYTMQFKPCYGWTRSITLLDDHRLFSRFPQFASWSAEDHRRESEYALRSSVRLYATYAQLAADALTTYGDHGSLISGVLRDHFPEVVKDALRDVVRLADRESRRSVAHWKAGRRTFLTWSRLRDETRATIGGGTQ